MRMIDGKDVLPGDVLVSGMGAAFTVMDTHPHWVAYSGAGTNLGERLYGIARDDMANETFLLLYRPEGQTVS